LYRVYKKIQANSVNVKQFIHCGELRPDISALLRVYFNKTAMQERQRFSALYVRDFRLFWLSQIISLSGTWMHSVAQSWLVYSLTKSPLYLGLVASLSSLPILLFTLFGGMVADTYPKRNVLIVTQTLSMVPALVVAILTDLGAITVWYVCMTAAFLGTVNAFDVPTRQSFIGEVVEKRDITSAIALNSVAFNGARIMGPVIAGFVIASSGIPACFYLNAFSFVPVLFALWKIKAGRRPERTQRSFLTGLGDGWRFIRQERTVFSIMIWIALFSLFGIPYVTLLPVLAEEVLRSGVKGLSLLMASAGAGSLMGALSIAFAGELKNERTMIPLSGMVFSCAILAISLSTTFLLSAALFFWAGWGIVTFLAGSNSFIQRVVPDGLRGRVMSAYTLVFLGLAPLGNSLIGVTADSIGTVRSLELFSVICIGGSAVLGRLFRVNHRGSGR